MADPPPVDAEAAKKAFETVRPRLLALPSDALAVVSTDVRKASIVAARISRFVKEPAVRARFAKLPKPADGGLDQAHVDDLETVALCTYHATVEQLSALAGATEAKLPASLVEKAYATRKRMLSCLEYYRGDDPVDGPEIIDIKRDTGYADLASDLLWCIKMSVKNLDQIKLDTKHFRDTDLADAGRIAHTMITLLGEAKKQEEKVWTDLVIRSFMLLTTIYDQVAVPGRWLYRHDRPDERFPSLYAAGRSSASRAKKGPAGGTESGQGGTGTG